MNKQILEAEKAAFLKLRAYDGVNMTLHTNGYDGVRRMGYEGMPGPADFTQDELAQTFDLSITNAATATRICLLSGGFAGTSAAGLVDTTQAFNDKNGNAGLTATTTAPRTFPQIVEFAKSSPIQLLGITIVSNMDGQRSQKLTIRKQAPTRDLGDMPFPLSPDVSAKDNTLKNSRLDLRPHKALIGPQTVIELPIVASSTAIVTLYFGRVANIEAAFFNSI